jgi:hypothetical protein
VVVLTTRLNLIFPLPVLVSAPDSQPPGDATGSVIADYRAPSIPTMPLRAVSSDLDGPRGLVGSGLVVHGVSVVVARAPRRPYPSPKSTIGDIVNCTQRGDCLLFALGFGRLESLVVERGQLLPARGLRLSDTQIGSLTLAPGTGFSGLPPVSRSPFSAMSARIMPPLRAASFLIPVVQRGCRPLRPLACSRAGRLGGRMPRPAPKLEWCISKPQSR